MKMNGKANEISKNFGRFDFSLFSVESLYQLSLDPTSKVLPLAEMFINKYVAEYKNTIPNQVALLKIKILLAGKKF